MSINKDLNYERSYYKKPELREEEEKNKEKFEVAIMKFPRVCKIGTPNVNGILYEEKSYRTALEELCKFGTVFGEVIITKESNFYSMLNINWNRYTHINPSNSIRVCEVDDECVSYYIKDKKFAEFIKEQIANGTQIVSCMRMIGKAIEDGSRKDQNVYEIIKIIGFDLLIKEDFEFTTYSDFIRKELIKNLNQM